MSAPPPPQLPPVHISCPIRSKYTKDTKLDITQELEATMPLPEIADQNCASVLISNGERIIESNEGKVQCDRCEKFLKPELITAHYNSHSTQILPWLYLGGQINAKNYTELTKRTDIKHILNCAHECSPLFPDEFQYYSINLYDNSTQDLTEAFDFGVKLLEEISKKGENILIHCVQGLSRSASIVIAYLMIHHKMTLIEAYTLVKMRRPLVKPNPGFIVQLLALEEKLYGSVTLDISEIYCKCQLPPQNNEICVCNI